MAIGQSIEQLEPALENAGGAGLEVAGVLRLFGAGAAGSIVLALGDGPLRTKELTTRVPGYTPRTVYRYISKLVEIGAIDREEEPGVPSKVVHSLADPCGVDLHELVDAFAQASLEILPSGGIVPHSWGSLTLLADLWESGMFQKLNVGPCTATELAGVGHDLSFHQVSRRTSLFMIDGLIRETHDGGRRRRYELTEQARRETAMIAGLGRWHERHMAPAGEPGVSAVEAADLLRAALPLAVLPEHAGKGFRLTVVPPEHSDGDEGEVVWAEVRPDGAAVSCIGPLDETDGWGRGEVGGWIEMLLQGTSKGIGVGGNEGPLVRSCLRKVQAALWTRPLQT
jgi:DNA-binding HxlR family transcriptional regulator